MSVITRVADRVLPGWQHVSAKRLWFEIFLISTGYAAYTWVRNRSGSAAVTPQDAAENADLIIELEETLGLFVEADVQMAFADNITFLQFWNIYYGALHFLTTYVVLVFLFLRFPEKYRFWRRALGLASLVGLVGYALFPLMPPRLLSSCGRFGACRTESPFVDTLLTAGGFWNFENDTVAALSNQFAAMPSLHQAYAIWVAAAAIPQLRHRVGKVLVGIYPLGMLFAIVVTGNHFILDAIAGAVAVAVAYGLTLLWEQVTQKRRALSSGSDDLATSVVAGATQPDHRAS